LLEITIFSGPRPFSSLDIPFFSQPSLGFRSFAAISQNMLVTMAAVVCLPPPTCVDCVRSPPSAVRGFFSPGGQRPSLRVLSQAGPQALPPPLQPDFFGNPPLCPRFSAGHPSSHPSPQVQLVHVWRHFTHTLFSRAWFFFFPPSCTDLPFPVEISRDVD